MGQLPRAYLVHTVTVEPYTGPTPEWSGYGPPRPVRCLVQHRVASRWTGAGRQIDAEATIYAAPDTVCPTGSRITLPDGRTGYAAAAVQHDGGGLAAPDHLEVIWAAGTAAAPPAGETVTLLRRTLTGRDPYGNDRYTIAEYEVAGCAVTQLSTSEDGADTARVTELLEVLMPPGTAITALDRLRVRGAQYEVHGVPDVQRSAMTGTTTGVRVTARRVTG